MTRDRNLMRWIGILGIGLALLMLTAPADAARWKDPRKLKYPELGEIRTPEIDRHELPNGMIVYLLEEHEFPLVDCRMLIRAGSIYEPEAKRGLAQITGEVLRTGGSTSIPGDELDGKLEAMGAFLESQIGGTDGRVTCSFLSEDAFEGLGILADLLRNPAFPEEKIDLAKVSLRTEISSRNDEPIPVASREFRKLMYGEHSPYGWYPEYETVASITRDDLVLFHREFFHPNQMILSIVGDFESRQMLAEVERIFAGWPRSNRQLPPDPPVPERAPQGVFHAQKEGVTQSTILFGLPGKLASDPDYAALQLLNQVLGAGFSSRLFNEVRTNRGLSYAVGSTPGTGFHHRAVWVSYLLTQADSTIVATQLMRAEIDKLIAGGITEDELQMAKDIVLNSLVFDFSTKNRVLFRKAQYELEGYDTDFLEKYQEQVRTLTTEDIHAAAKRLIKPDEMTMVVVGPKEDFDGPLESLGPVTEIDITIPDPPSELSIPEPTAETLERGNAILQDALAAHGGPTLQRVRTVRQVSRGTLTLMGNEMGATMTNITVLPDREWSEINLGMFVILQVADGASGWMKAPQGQIVDWGPDEIAAGREGQVRSIFHFLPKGGEMTWQALEPQDLEGTLCDVVYGRGAIVKEWVLYFDQNDHILRGMDYRGQGPMGPVSAREVYEDYRNIAGVKIAHALKILHDDEVFLTATISEIALDGEIDESIFSKPE